MISNILEGVNMYADYARERFKQHKDTDSDYLLICRKDDPSRQSHNVIPLGDYWGTIEEAIEWHLKCGYTTVEIYDLYAPFETSMIRMVNKGYHQTILAGDIVDMNFLP